MAQPYIGEVRMFAGSFAPAGWAFCDGQLMPISENDALFVVLGTTYGGDGQETFALPNLQSRIPIHAGAGPGGITRVIGEMGGAESVTLTTQTIPVHNHAFLASTATGTQNSPAGEVLASGSSVLIYRPQAPSQPMAAQTISPTGGSQPHDNMVPYLCISFIISLFGLFPQQN